MRVPVLLSCGVLLVGFLVTAAGSTASASPHSPVVAAPSEASAVTPTVPPPAVRVLLLGDSTALTLGEGLGEPSVEQQYNYTLVDDGIIGCGVAEGPFVEVMGERDAVGPACNGSVPAPGAPLADQPWPVQWLRDIGNDHPNVVALLAGRWEVVDRVYQGKWTNILKPAFAAYVKRQLEEASNLVTASGAHMVFLTAPCTYEGYQPDGAPWPEENPERLAAYNRLIREVAAESPRTDSVANLEAAACPGGRYANAVDGVTIRTVDDGIHFSPAGGVMLAPSIMPAIVAAGRPGGPSRPTRTRSDAGRHEPGRLPGA
jgi:hypothetical protein